MRVSHDALILVVNRANSSYHINMTNNSDRLCHSSAGLEERHVTVYRQRSGQHFIFEHVPALVCKNCGHRYFDIDIVEAMDTRMADPATLEKAVPVPVVFLG